MTVPSAPKTPPVQPNPPEPTPAATLPLSTASKSWRFAGALVGLILLSIGQVISTNDWYPLGSLSQYSYGRPLNAPTKAIRIIATTTDGEEMRVPLNPKGVGVGRAEIEGQVTEILADPSRLEGIARAWHGLHPHRPQFVQLRMERTISYIENGKPTGEYDVEFLTEWTVKGNYGEQP